MSFNATVSLPDNSRRVDVDEMPLAAVCARCVKRYIQNPSHKCEIRPGQQNCKYCKKGNSGCDLIPISAVKQVRLVQEAALKMEQWLARNPPDFPDVFDFAQYIADNKDKLDKGKRPEQRADGSYAHPQEFPQEYCTLLERTWVLSDMMNSATKSGKTNQMSTYEAAHIKVLKELLQAILRTNDILTAAHHLQPSADQSSQPLKDGVLRFFYQD